MANGHNSYSCAMFEYDDEDEVSPSFDFYNLNY